MKVYFKDIPSIILENEKAYFSLLEGAINSVDEFSTMTVRKNPTNYQFRIALSSGIYITNLMKVLNDLHNMLNINVEYSKSIKSSYAITFNISLT